MWCGARPWRISTGQEATVPWRKGNMSASWLTSWNSCRRDLPGHPPPHRGPSPGGTGGSGRCRNNLALTGIRKEPARRGSCQGAPVMGRRIFSRGEGQGPYFLTKKPIKTGKIVKVMKLKPHILLLSYCPVCFLPSPASCPPAGPRPLRLLPPRYRSGAAPVSTRWRSSSRRLAGRSPPAAGAGEDLLSG